MNPRDWIAVAFILAGIMAVSAMWAADRQTKRQAAAESIEAVSAPPTPFEHDRARAVEKIKRIYGGGK